MRYSMVEDRCVCEGGGDFTSWPISCNDEASPTSSKSYNSTLQEKEFLLDI